MIKTDTDVLIVGGGIAGLTLAAALGSAGLRVISLDREAVAAQTSTTYDGRTTALSFASRQILGGAGVWPHLAGVVEPIRTIRVTDDASPLHLHFPEGAVEVAGQTPPFGWIAENRLIRLALLARLKELKSVQHRASTAVTALDFGQTHATATLKGGKKLTAFLVVGADGKDSFCRKAAGIKTMASAYSQTAIVCTIKHTLPHHGVALENFLPHGPFAALPMQGNRSSIVWSEKAELAPHYLALSERDFIAELEARMGTHLGKISLASPRFAYPLSVLHANRYIAPRLALVSEAAHRMHPIAGQGLNIGLRDIALLAELVVEAARTGGNIASPALLQRYQRGRRLDTLAMLGGTHALTHFFSNRSPTLTALRRLGLAGVEKTTHTKGFFMRYAMGLVGPKLRLLQGKPL